MGVWLNATHCARTTSRMYSWEVGLFLWTFFFLGICQLPYTQPPATCTVMELYTNAHNRMYLTDCAVNSLDRQNCTLTCTNPMPNAIPRLKVAVLPNCNNVGIGVHISTEDFDGTVLQSGIFYSNTTVPLSSSLSYVVTVGQMSTVYLIFELYLRVSDPINGVTIHQLLPFFTIPVDSTYFNCPPPIAFLQEDSCSSLDAIVRGSPYPLVGNCMRNSNCSSIRCGQSGILTSVPFTTVTLLPCSSPPSINIIVVGINAELEVNVTLSSSANVNFFSSSLGVLNANITRTSSSSVGFGFSITAPGNEIPLSIIPFTVIPLSLSGCTGAPSTSSSAVPSVSTLTPRTTAHISTPSILSTKQTQSSSAMPAPRTSPATNPTDPSSTPPSMVPFINVTSPTPSTAPGIPYKIRLIGGKNYLSGRLEIKINHTWGTVCDFDNSFNSSAATFACKQLQFGRGQYKRFGIASKLGYSNISYSLPIVMSNVNCPSYPSHYSPSATIQRLCQYQYPPSTGCTEETNVALECERCTGYTCKEGRCAEPCNGVRECRDGSDEGTDVCTVGSGLSTTAKIAIGMVVGIIALLIAITMATITAAWVFSGRRSTHTSERSSSDEVPTMKYTTLEEED